MPDESLLKCALQVAKDIAPNYPQKWGDCYKINGTVKKFINERLSEEGFRPIARLWQVWAILDDEIYDSKAVGSTDEPAHQMLTIGFDGSKYEPPKYGDERWHDFSNVFVGEREANIIDIIPDDEMAGNQIDTKLLFLLDNEFDNRCTHLEKCTRRSGDFEGFDG